MAEILTLDSLATRLLARSGKARLLVAIAGAPGAGKSTVARALVDRLNGAHAGCAAILEMDGFHYDDRVLRALGRLERKGAPDTFDVAGLRHILARLRDPAEGAIAVPVFDREIEIARAGAAMIAPDARLIIVEGNYLLLDQPPWGQLAGAFDVTVMLRVRVETLRARLAARWQGLGLSPEDSQRKIEENDLPNGELVSTHSRPVDVVLENECE